jgi:hypothetical protein
MQYTKVKMTLAVISLLPVLLFFAILAFARVQLNYELSDGQQIALFLSLAGTIGTLGSVYAYRMGRRLPNALWH